MHQINPHQRNRPADHLTDAADRGADNAVTLIAGKPAWIRVYVRSGFFTDITGVTGSVELGVDPADAAGTR